MGNKVLAIFESAEEAIAAAQDLRQSGLANGRLSLCSAEPIQSEVDLEVEGRKSRIGLFAIAGGLAGATAAILLTALTSIQMNLVTGGMPIVAPWAFGIIVFEMTALGAIFATLGRMIVEGRLITHALPEECDRAVAEGRSVVVVDVTDSTASNGSDAIEEILSRRGAQMVTPRLD